MIIELIHDADCPNVLAAREVLRQALAASGLPPEWTEWVRGAPRTPPHAERFGSPTILVDGRDVAPEVDPAGSACRLYRGEDGRFLPTPPLRAVHEALSSAFERGRYGER